MVSTALLSSRLVGEHHAGVGVQSARRLRLGDVARSAVFTGGLAREGLPDPFLNLLLMVGHHTGAPFLGSRRQSPSWRRDARAAMN